MREPEWSWRKKPTGITIPATIGERCRGWWRFGIGFHRVWFADHRSGWAGVIFHIYFFDRDWNFCIIRWKPPYKKPEPTLTLHQQVATTHNRWAGYDAKMEKIEQEEQEYLELQQKIVEEGLRRRAVDENGEP